MAHPEIFKPTALTLPMVLVGVVLGTFACSANMYFGLQIGSVNTMSTATALMSFAIFRSARRWLPRATSFTPTENVVVQAIASSIAGMPLAASMISVVPAFEFLARPNEGLNRQFSFLTLTIWSLGVSLCGTVFAVPFREYFLLRQRLRFPGGYATGVLVGLIHKNSVIANNTALDKKGMSYMDVAVRDEHEPLDPAIRSDGPDEPRHSDNESAWVSKIYLIVRAFFGTTLYIIVSYFVPALNAMPVFGSIAARRWLWFITLSPAFASFGMVLDMPTACFMVLGAVLGWGLLSPLAKQQGWAPGPTDSLEDGSRGWLIWISIAFLLGDAFARVSQILIRFVLQFIDRYGLLDLLSARSADANHNSEGSLDPLIPQEPPRHDGAATTSHMRQMSGNNTVSSSSLACWSLTSIILCVSCTKFVFEYVPVLLTVTALLMAFPFCLIVMQSTGETDTAPSNSISNAFQFLFVLLLPQASSARLLTMVLGGIVEAGLWQSAVLMTDLKTAYLVHASPKVMFRAQMLGSVIGSVLGSATYRMFTSFYPIPGEKFPVPMAYMWVNTARLAIGGGLPRGVPQVGTAGFVLAFLLRVASIAARRQWWNVLVPSGVAISMGMYVTPSVSLAKLCGASLRLYLMKRWSVSEVSLMAAATGCILGEGTLGFLPVVLDRVGVPHLS